MDEKREECTQMVEISLEEYVRLQWEAGFGAGMLQVLEK